MITRFENIATMRLEKEYDERVKEELMLAGIPVIKLPSHMDTEVKTRYIGLLNGFMFYRAWRYWVCTGHMPLDKAEELYNQHKDLEIRAGGHCGNLPPEQMSVNPAHTKRLEQHLNDVGIDEFLKTRDNIVDDMTEPRYVDMYHIDTLLGLQKLAEHIKNNNIRTEPL